MSYVVFCDDCEYLSPKESEQQRGQDHVCSLLKTRLFHMQVHPHIVRHPNCPKGSE